MRRPCKTVLGTLGMTGAFPLTFQKGAEEPFHNSSIGADSMVYRDRLETNLLQLFAHRENSESFSIICCLWGQHCCWTEIGNDLFFISFHYPQLFLPPCPTAAPACLTRGMYRLVLGVSELVQGQCSRVLLPLTCAQRHPPEKPRGAR